YELDKNKVHTIFNPVPDLVDFDIKNPNAPHGRGENINDEIVFAGRLIVMKNIENLLKGFKKADLKNNKLVIIGDGPQKEKLIKLANDLDLNDKVDFLPSLAQKDLYKRIINCKYFVFASWTDISPNQFYENISLKIPTLMTKENYLSVYDQIPLMIDPNSSEDIADKMNYLDNEENYQKFADDFSKIQFQNSWDDVLNEHLKVFEMVNK
ncbi:glycosyltransferase, partial [Candidatus Parcubacteria bacterium]|nr:glycosyltransferase [Candidatus Parcubacteria bacterium]